MAVSAYASVLSLMHTVDNALLPFRRNLLANATQIETLQENLGMLLDVLEKFPSKINEDLVRQIPGISNEADNIIDCYIVDRMLQDYGEKTDMDMFYSFCRNIDRVLQKIVAIKQRLMIETTLKDDQKIGRSYQNFKVPVPESSSSVTALADKGGAVVGFEKPFLEIMEKLDARHGPNLQVIPILGMGGIGKTTLAKIAFNSKRIAENFTIRIWLMISQDYDVRQILECLLNDGVLDNNKNKVNVQNTSELGLRLHQKLCGRKYLIVMDDVWSIQAWDDLRSFFPDNGNGSRIIVTSRISVVGSSLSSRNSYSIELLDVDSSWNLFANRAFAQGGRSLELEQIGTKIAKSCSGLPLALVVIGGLLANSNMTRTYWELVAKDVSSFANLEDDGNCLETLYLNYKYLPIHLKPCFLYMAVFSRNRNFFDVSVIIKRWIAEGFIKLVRDKTLEEVARAHVKDLVDRNLIGIDSLGSNGNIRSFRHS